MTRITDEEKVQALISYYKIKIPKNWDTLKTPQKLEFLAHRLLIESRTSTKHSEMSKEGWLSESQLERRRRREVLSKFGSLDVVPPTAGTFGRIHSKGHQPRETDE